MKLSRIVVAAVLAAILVLPGCFLCTIRPQVKAASETVDRIVARFDVIYPAVQRALAAAQILNLPDVETFDAAVKAAKARIDHVYFDVLCPSQDDVSQAQAALDKMEETNQVINTSLAKFYMAHPEMIKR